MGVDSVLAVIYYAVGLLVALVAHEYAHAFTAVRLGDSFPRAAGRLTLNPKPHVDTFGTLVLPAILLLPVLFGRPVFPVFAYGKPWDRDVFPARRSRREEITVAAAGPVANLILAVAVGALLRGLRPTSAFGDVLVAFLQVNVILAVFNLVPLPPLDASRVVAGFLPPRAGQVYRSWDQYGALFILVIFFVIPTPIFAFVNAVGNGVCTLVAGGSCLGG